MSKTWAAYGESVSLGRSSYTLVNFFTERTDKCVVCGEPAFAIVSGSRKVCSKNCGKELVMDDFEKLMDQAREMLEDKNESETHN